METKIGPISLEENLKQIPEEEVHHYLGSLEKQLQNLANILAKEKDRIAIPYVQSLSDTITCLDLKHSLVGQDKISFSLTIAPTNCGFPTVTDLYLLQEDKYK